jgi:SAM-dependent methyltransferase
LTEGQKIEQAPAGDQGWVDCFGELYQRLGPETKAALLELLPDDWSFEGKRVLDFGCGYGRTLEHFRSEAEGAEFWGADIDAQNIGQLEASLCPPMHALRCEVDPPLGLEPGSFDVIWAISVFTHLTDNSIPWLLELHRLLEPGGLLIATYMGRWHSELLAEEPWNEDRVGMNVLKHNQGWELGGPMVLMSDWWVDAHWGRAFEVLEVAEVHHQSWALMRKRDVRLTPEDVERPSDDPRELLALRHNLRQAQREIERDQGEHAAQLDALRGEYERSLSWRLTRPLREAARRARRMAARHRGG